MTRPIARFPEVVPELTGDGVFLRAFAEADLPAWFERATDRASADLAGDPMPSSIDEGVAMLRRQRERFEARRAIRWAVVPAGAASSAGSVGLGMRADEPDVADFSIVIGRAHWDRGLGTAATRRVTGYGFEALGLGRIHAEVLQRNPRSIRLLEKAGFRRHRAYVSEVDQEACFEYVIGRP